MLINNFTYFIVRSFPLRYKESLLYLNKSLYSLNFVKFTKPKPRDFPLIESLIILLDITDGNDLLKNDVNSLSVIEISRFPTYILSYKNLFL